ncbi:alpha/beta hydrolase, partial [bacterium]
MKIIIVALVFLMVLFGWVRWQERAAVFFPSREMMGDPEDYDLPFEDVWFTSGDGSKLHGWFIPGNSDITVLWLHGNAGNISDRLHILKEFSDNLKVSGFIFDFRGYGNSQGRPTEKGLYSDTESAFSWLTKEKGVDPGSVFIYGHSLGSAPSVKLALGAGHRAAGVVLESPFTSAGEMARLLYGGLPVDLLLSLKLDIIGKVEKLEVPVMVIHGEGDTVIPFDMGKRVYEAASEPKTFLPVRGGDHGDCYIV